MKSECQLVQPEQQGQSDRSKKCRYKPFFFFVSKSKMRFRGECTEDAPLFQCKGKEKE